MNTSLLKLKKINKIRDLIPVMENFIVIYSFPILASSRLKQWEKKIILNFGFSLKSIPKNCILQFLKKKHNILVTINGAATVVLGFVKALPVYVSYLKNLPRGRNNTVCFFLCLMYFSVLNFSQLLSFKSKFFQTTFPLILKVNKILVRFMSFFFSFFFKNDFENYEIKQLY